MERDRNLLAYTGAISKSKENGNTHSIETMDPIPSTSPSLSNSESPVLEFTGNWFVDAGILGFVNLMEE